MGDEWECPWRNGRVCELHELNGLGCFCGQANRGAVAPQTGPSPVAPKEPKA